GAVLRYRARYVGPRAVRVHHSQQEHHGARLAVDRRNHERTGRVAPGHGRRRRGRAAGGGLSAPGVHGMMSELRWTLLILGVVFIAALAWWERHRPRQASRSSAAERTAAREPAADAAPRTLREPTLSLPQMRARDPLAMHDLPVVEVARDPPALPVLGPAPPGHVRPGDAPAEPVGPAGTESAADDTPGGDAAAMDVGHGVPAGVPLESLPSLPPAAEPLVDWPPDERRRIVALRLVAPQPERFAGRSLRQALAAEGFVLGRFAIFHKPDEEQRAVLRAASLTRP